MEYPFGHYYSTTLNTHITVKTVTGHPLLYGVHDGTTGEFITRYNLDQLEDMLARYDFTSTTRFHPRKRDDSAALATS